MIFILYIGLHKKRQNASCSFECENRVSTEKRQEMGEGRSESGQWRLLAINVPKRLAPYIASNSTALQWDRISLACPLFSTAFPYVFPHIARGESFRTIADVTTG